MKKEVQTAVNFFKRLAMTRGKLEPAKAELFGQKLYQLLCEKYANHWYPESPTKGQGYRCIRINGVSKTDEVVLRACVESGVTLSSLGLPSELTVWIDPMEVCVRSAENGRPFSIARFCDNEERASARRQPSHVDTSDYHSETSSDSSSIVSSDIEEDQKEVKEKRANAVPVITRVSMKGSTYKIAMVPRVRTRPTDGPTKVKVVRQMVPSTVQYVHPAPAQVWTYSKATPVFLTPVCTPVMAPPPPPPPPTHHQQLYGYFVLQSPSPQFVVPQAALQPFEVPMN